MILKRKIVVANKEELKSHLDTKEFYSCRNRFKKKLAKDKNHCKVRDHCHYTVTYRDTAHSICNLMPNEILVVFVVAQVMTIILF